jgi:predicted nucleotidyltransferase
MRSGKGWLVVEGEKDSPLFLFFQYKMCYNIFSLKRNVFMLTKKAIVKTLQGNIEEIQTYGVKRIGIFGSFIKSAQSKKRDIDILVEFRKGEKIFDNYMELKFYLERLFHRKVDLVIKDALKPRLKKNVLKEVAYAKL